MRVLLITLVLEERFISSGSCQDCMLNALVAQYVLWKNAFEFACQCAERLLGFRVDFEETAKVFVIIHSLGLLKSTQMI